MKHSTTTYFNWLWRLSLWDWKSMLPVIQTEEKQKFSLNYYGKKFYLGGLYAADTNLVVADKNAEKYAFCVEKNNSGSEGIPGFKIDILMGKFNLPYRYTKNGYRGVGIFHF